MSNHRYLLILGVLLLGIGAGCASDQTHPFTPAVAVPMGLAVPDAHVAVIGPQGGSVANGNVRLDVPAGALDAPTAIGIEILSDGSIDLSPNGQQFRVPVSLTFFVDAGKNPARHVVEWFNPAAGWVAIPSLVAPAKRVAPLMHFSIYRIVNLE